VLETRRLGRSELRITKVGIGTAPIGSTPDWRIYWGRQDEGDAIRAIHTAIDLGVNWIDTAPFYGWGRAEEIVGRAVKGRRDDLLLFTKCGTLPDGRRGWIDDLRPKTIRRELEASLKRLQTDYVDLLQFHDPDPRTPIEDSWSELRELIDEGLVRFGGLSNHPVELVERASKVGPVTSNQHEYNPLERGIENDILPFSRDHGIGVLGWGSLAEGFLTDGFDLARLDPKDFRHGHRYARPENSSRITRVRSALLEIARARGRTLIDLVIAWELMHPALTAAIIGVRSEAEARGMIGGVDWSLSAEEMRAVDRALASWTRTS